MADRILSTTGSVTTILGAVNQLSRFLNMEYVPYRETTLNSKYNVIKDDVPGANESPQLMYFGCGINGFKNTDTESGSARYSPVCTNLDLYEPIPVLAFASAEDEASDHGFNLKQYRMRQVDPTTGHIYYWLKQVTADPNTIEVKILNGENEETDYTFDPGNLNPTPILPEEGGSIDTNVNRIIVRGTLTVELTYEEISTVVNVYGGGQFDKYGRISEYGFYTGCERFANSEHVIVDNPTAPYREAAYVQLAKHICNRGIDLTEPGMVITPKVCFEYADILPVQNS